jgi:RNA polymerase sigma-70 factor (ECF subfamily)
VDEKHRLSQISTRWTMVFQAHRDTADAVRVAQETLLHRYLGAIYRYLLGALRDADAADELAQEFALRFVRGDFKRADPQRGRFRDYVKTSLRHLIQHYQKKQAGRPQALPEAGNDPAAPDEPAGAADDRAFTDRWREELLDRAWEALAAVERQTGSLFHTVLQYRAANPQATSDAMAEALSARVGRPLTAASVRQTLHRAREKFADLLLDEVARSLQTEEADWLEQELIDLELLSYCRTAMQRYRDRAAG